MLILFDHGTPAPLRSFLKDHTVKKTKDLGWDTLSNGELLRAAEEATFDYWGSTALAGAVTLSSTIVAVAGLGELAIRTNACLGVHAPEQAVIAGGHSGVAFGINEKPLPAKPGTQVRVVCIEALALGSRNHAAPPR